MTSFSQIFDDCPAIVKAAAAVIVVVGGPVAFLVYQHGRLSRKVRHSKSEGPLSELPLGDIRSMPEKYLQKDIVDNTRGVYDVASISTATTKVSPWIPDEEILTRYLRRNMTAFSRMPQAFVLSLSCDQCARKTFKASHIQKLNFEPGDVVCGGYTVAHREQNRVEFAMELDEIRGRLVCSFEEKEGLIIFTTQTLMWQPSHVATPMPLDNFFLKYAHEITSWWMLEAGLLYITDYSLI